jgi:hypothetical protein
MFIFVSYTDPFPLVVFACTWSLIHMWLVVFSMEFINKCFGKDMQLAFHAFPFMQIGLSYLIPSSCSYPQYFTWHEKGTLSRKS